MSTAASAAEGARSPSAAAPARQRRSALDQLALRVSACRGCARLVAWREQAALDPRGGHLGEEYWARPLPGFGDPSGALVLVGLAPAAHGGNRTGRMFTGDRSGDFLFAALHRCGFASQPTSSHRDDGLELHGAYVTAPVRCAPPQNRPSVSERDRCAPFFLEELVLLGAARVYLALGAFAFEALWRALSPGGARPRFAHGLELELDPAGNTRRTLLCSYHPSQRNVFTGLLSAAMFDAVLRRARELVD